MMNDPLILIQRFLTDQISDEDKKILQNWLNADPENHNKFEQIKEIWKLTEYPAEPEFDLEEEKLKILQKILKSDDPSMDNK